MAPKLLGVIMSKLIHLFFNYQLGLVSLELTQNICEGRGCRVNILTNKRSNDLSKWKKLSQTPKNAIIKVIKLRQNNKLNN